MEIIWGIVLTAIMAPVYIYVYYKYYKTTIYENGRIMFLKIPYENKDDKDIIRIAKEAQRVIIITCFIHLIAMIIYFFFIEYFVNAFFVVTFVVLLILPLNVLIISLNKKYDELNEIKTENNWLSYSQYSIYFDTKIVSSGLNRKYNKLISMDILSSIVLLIFYFIFKEKVELFQMILLIFTSNIYF